MSTSARKENRWARQLRRENDEADKLKRELEAISMTRTQAKPHTNKKTQQMPTRRTVKNWMVLHAEQYDTATQLVEAIAASMNIPEQWLDDETHWLWDQAVLAFEQQWRVISIPNRAGQ